MPGQPMDLAVGVGGEVPGGTPPASGHPERTGGRDTLTVGL